MKRTKSEQSKGSAGVNMLSIYFYSNQVDTLILRIWILSRKPSQPHLSLLLRTPGLAINLYLWKTPCGIHCGALVSCSYLILSSSWRQTSLFSIASEQNPGFLDWHPKAAFRAINLEIVHPYMLYCRSREPEITSMRTLWETMLIVIPYTDMFP